MLLGINKQQLKWDEAKPSAISIALLVLLIPNDMVTHAITHTDYYFYFIFAIDLVKNSDLVYRCEQITNTK